MTKRKRRIMGLIFLCALLLVGIGIYVCSKGTVEVPEIRESLDTTLNENEFYLSEDNFKEVMEQEIEPYIANYMTDGFVENEGLKLYYRMFQTGTAKRAVVISHGFTEYLERYNEMTYYYLQAGYDVYIIEHRGHGASGREVTDLSMVHVDSFEDYQKDFKVFMDEIVVPNNGSKPLYLFAHSMGGAIAAHFLEENPEYFKAAVLSTPMMDVKTGSIPEPIADMVAKTACLIGKSKSYLIGYGPYEGIYDVEGSSAASAARYDYYYNMEIDNELHHTNSPSNSWLTSAIAETKQILKEENLAKIKIPVLLFQAENDTLVEPEGLYKFAAGVENLTFKYVEGSRHQIFSSENDITIPYYNTVFAFFEAAN